MCTPELCALVKETGVAPDRVDASPSSAAGSALARHRKNQRVALTAAAAERGNAGAAPTPLQLQGQVQGNSCAGHSDWVAERDGAAIDVDDVLAQAKRPRRGDADGSEGLVDLHQIKIGGGDARLVARCLDR